MITAVLDTNVILAMAAGHDRLDGVMSKLWLAWNAERFLHVSSRFILVETGRHLSEGYFLLRVPEHIRLHTMQLLRANIVDLRDEVSTGIASHVEDDWVLAIAFQEHVDFLVTGDIQLLLRDGFEGLRIVTPRMFVDILAEDVP